VLGRGRSLQSHSWQLNRTLRLGLGGLGFFFFCYFQIARIFSYLFIFLTKLQRDRRGIDAGNVAKPSLNCEAEALALNPRRDREGRGGLNLCPPLPRRPSPGDGELRGQGEQQTPGRWGADPAPAREPETQPGAGRTWVDLFWRQQSSERRLVPGFGNVGQRSHTPTEMALFSKIQPAPTVSLGV